MQIESIIFVITVTSALLLRHSVRVSQNKNRGSWWQGIRVEEFYDPFVCRCIEESPWPLLP